MDSDHYMSNGYAWLDSGLFVQPRTVSLEWTITTGYDCVIISRVNNYYMKTTTCDTLAGYVCRKDPQGKTLSAYCVVFYCYCSYCPSLLEFGC